MSKQIDYHLANIEWGNTPSVVRAKLRADIHADFGRLKSKDADASEEVLRGNVSLKSAKFKLVTTDKYDGGTTPSMTLLGFCANLDAITRKPAYKGSSVRVTIEQLPNTVQTWIAENCRVVQTPVAKVEEPVTA